MQKKKLKIKKLEKYCWERFIFVAWAQLRRGPEGLLAAAGRKEKEKKEKKRKENKLLFLVVVCTIWIIKVGARTSAMHKTSLDLSLKGLQ